MCWFRIRRQKFPTRHRFLYWILSHKSFSPPHILWENVLTYLWIKVYSHLNDVIMSDCLMNVVYIHPSCLHGIENEKLRVTTFSHVLIFSICAICALDLTKQLIAFMSSTERGILLCGNIMFVWWSGCPPAREFEAQRHPCLEWDSNPRSQRSNERRQFMP
jgi:hypothetical protein